MKRENKTIKSFVTKKNGNSILIPFFFFIHFNQLQCVFLSLFFPAKIEKTLLENKFQKKKFHFSLFHLL